MAPQCTSCYEDDVIFECATNRCTYGLCRQCVCNAFEDCSGSNNRNCPLCKAPSAKDMAIAQIGQGGVMAVERELRPVVEHQVRQELSRLEARKKDASEINEKAIQLYNRVVELLNLNCPRCKMVFHDYDGCNALKCECNATFCAICLKDCGNDQDTHAHVLETHGDLFDKDMFHKSKTKREKQSVLVFLENLRAKGESFELVQLVSNLLHKGGHTDENSGGDGVEKAETFIRVASQDLERMIRADRLSVLGDCNKSAPNFRISSEHISPRCIIQEDIQVYLVPADGNNDKEAYQIDLHVHLNGSWRKVETDELKALMKQGEIRTSSVENIQHGIRCAVLAFEGERNLYQTECIKTYGPELMVLRFSRINIKDGSIQAVLPEDFEPHPRRILAFNPNQRIKSLQAHVLTNVTGRNLPLPLKHLIGAGRATPVLTNLVATVEESVLDRLNAEQLEAVHPLNLKSAGEVAGPPGTGKTHTISAMVRSLLSSSDKNIIVLSERNGAIDAIADKFLSSCFDMQNGKLSKLVDMDMWMNILTYGSPEAIGTNTKEFLVPQKKQWHPELLEAKKTETKHKKALHTRAEAMRASLADEIKGFGDRFDDDNAWAQHRIILKDPIPGELTTPSNIITSVERCLVHLVDLQTSKITEDAVIETVGKNSTLLDNLFAIPRGEKVRFGTKEEPSWNKKNVSMRTTDMINRLSTQAHSDLFEDESCRELEMQWRQAQENRQRIETRVEADMETQARLKMSTIGSSHKLFAASPKDQDGEKDELEDHLDSLSMDGGDQGTIVIFDEAGCIPSYELLGLSRLGCNIDAILVVGDIHQLSPYNPDDTGKPQSKRSQARKHKQRKSKNLSSILDVSDVAVIKLTTQYRVPRDIADILNARIYNGSYQTSLRSVPIRGMAFKHVPLENHPLLENVNPVEVAEVLRLLKEKVAASRSGTVSVMVLTPYKNQQKEIQFQLKHSRINVSEDRILTIDRTRSRFSHL